VSVEQVSVFRHAAVAPAGYAQGGHGRCARKLECDRRRLEFGAGHPRILDDQDMAVGDPVAEVPWQFEPVLAYPPLCIGDSRAGVENNPAVAVIVAVHASREFDDRVVGAGTARRGHEGHRTPRRAGGLGNARAVNIGRGKTISFMSSRHLGADGDCLYARTVYADWCIPRSA